MSITVTERQLDEKHRVTVPSNFASNLKKGGKVIVVTYEDQAVIITPDKRVADELSLCFAGMKSSVRWKR